MSEEAVDSAVVVASPRRCRRCGTAWPIQARNPLIGTRCVICGAPLVHPDDFLDALQLDAYVQLSAALGWRGDDSVPRGVLKEDILRSVVPFVAQLCGQHYTAQGRAGGLQEAADEVHIEARWQQQQVQTARKVGKSMRGEFIERLLMVKTILTDRARRLTVLEDPADPRAIVHMFDLERDFGGVWPVGLNLPSSLGGEGRPVTAAEFERITGKKPEPRMVRGVELWMADLGGMTQCEVGRRKLQDAGYEAHSVIGILAAVRAPEEVETTDAE